MEEEIFKKGSTTYYWSSKFFPKSVRTDVFKLYSFVRVTDDFVDSIPQDSRSFYELKSMWKDSKKSNDPNIVRVVENIKYLQKKYDLKTEWIEAFLDSMEQDLDTSRYKTLDQSLAYVYGSADVVGLMMVKILGIDERSFVAAGRQGRAMQWINFIRDIDEDNVLGRCYFPQEDLKKFNLKDLTRKSAEADIDSYKKFMLTQIDRYKQWQEEAEAGYKYIPWRLRIPIKTASDMYNWTAHEIAKDPLVVYRKKVKPTKFRVLFTAIRNIF